MNTEFESMLHHDDFQEIDKCYRQDEEAFVQHLISLSPIDETNQKSIQKNAEQLMATLRAERTKTGGLDAFMFQYDLSSEEGIALMCLAEALLRIPDKGNIDKLIRDKLSSANWRSHMGKSHSIFVNAATWALMLTGKIIETPKDNTVVHNKGLTSAFKKLTARGGEPIIRQAISHAMKILGKQFVMGRSIKEALKRAKDKEAMGYTYSYDMLGEAAYTQEDADRYLKAYRDAIIEIGEANKGKGFLKSAGISIKLSALHPRYEVQKAKRLESELFEKVKDLVELAKSYDIGLTIDAEEADKLVLSLKLIEQILSSGVAKGWDGFGLAVQAYQKRALATIDYLKNLCEKHQQKLCIRLVKGAYWDTEIKLAQVQGLSEYPVFTRKASTDLNYHVCAKKLCEYKDHFYLQFATHNALTFCTVQHLCESHNVTHYEFQCLHGMGDAMYDSKTKSGTQCRIYAPVGSHEDLLPYLVRRLLENGANTSFVNRIANDQMPLSRMIQCPVEKLKSFPSIRHTRIPLPDNIYGSERLNSKGIDLSHANAFMPIFKQINESEQKEITVKPTQSLQSNPKPIALYSPVDTNLCLGHRIEADESEIIQTLDTAQAAFANWQFKPAVDRSAMLKRAADLLETKKIALYRLLMLEGGKILEDAINEVREAIDFCRYYANDAVKHGQPQKLPGPTGEENTLRLHGRGVVVCISPWNFPLAIFLGQITASLAAGNCVIAKPATQTTIIAKVAIDILHEAGFAKEVVQLLPTKGKWVGEKLLPDQRIKAVLFTGSTETAKQINRTLAERDGPIVPFIAETGGQNAMIVDSSALPEQVTEDVIMSSFKSAGQRCSALRVLFVQDNVADKVIKMIKGAMAELAVANPLSFATDVGPVIDGHAKEELMAHASRMDQEAIKIFETPLAEGHDKGHYFAPRAYEIKHINVLEEEVFGPILHIVRYKGEELEKVIDDINQTGYGLTLGIHSRIDETAQFIIKRARVGNIYVNRNIIGAVVGVQPFGGEGLSGTGPKAGGPNYVARLGTERTVSIDTTASGGNASLMSLSESEI